MTWNIHKGVGGLDRRYALDRTIAVLRYYDADILLLQEVASDMPSLGSDDQVQRLTDAMQMHPAFYPEHQFRRGGYGNLILSRWPVYETTHLDLTIGLRKKRGLVQAHVRARWSGHQRSLVVHNLHLGLAGSERDKQLRMFMESEPFRGVHKETPLLVGGDLNDLWGSLGPKHLLPAGLVRAGPLGNTFPSAYPMRPLDGLFYRGNLTIRDYGIGRSRLARAASDHLPLYADFDMY